MQSAYFIQSEASQLRKHNRLSQFLILVSFLLTFLSIRIVTHLQLANIIPNQSGILHIHHLVPGILLILFSGYIGISFWSNDRVRWIISILFGIGAALTLDEFALWLFLKDVYWAKQGRDSIDAIIIGATIMTIVFTISEVHGHSLFKRLLSKRNIF